MSTLREAAKEALRWMEHARLHLTIKERMHPDGLSLYDSAAEALRAALAQPEVPRYVGDARKHVICVYPDCVATNYREWREAVHDEWRLASEPPDSKRQVLGWQKRGHCESVHFLNGNWFVEATGRHTLTITHWRDVTPPTEGE